MKRLALFLLLFTAITLVQGQDVVLVFNQNNLTDESFGGKYTGFLHSESSTYRVDEAGRITGKHLTFHENGNIESAGMFEIGVKQGSWVKYSPDGKMLSQAYYNNGHKDGPWKVWDENGTLRCEMHYKNGKRVKTWKVYDASGTLTEEQAYAK